MNTYSIDRDSDTPLYIQIRNAITKAIESKEITPGDRLPPVSVLAKDIGVTQATVRRALQDLGKAGHTECHVGRGTFIRDANISDAPQIESSFSRHTTPPTEQVPSLPGTPNSLEFAAKRMRSGLRKSLVDIMTLAHREGIIQLTKGIPDGNMLPEHFLEEVTRETLEHGSEKYIQATDELGFYELREEIAIRFNEDGADITPDQVLITNGSMQAVTIAAQAALEQRPGVICETPCFQGIPDTFSALGHWVETVQRDTEGPVTETLYHLSGNQRRLLYLCPYVHNPTGYDLSPERYTEITEWAEKTGSTIIADELFKDIRYQDNAQQSLFTKLGGEQTIVVSSLSKSVMTGMRLGWMISSPGRIQELAQLKRLMDHSAPSLIQGMALNIFRSGKFDSHTAKMKKIYRQRMETLLKALTNFMPQGVSWTEPAGGFSLLVELPKGYSSVTLLLSAIDKGVSFLPGPLFDIDHRYAHALRLSTAWADKNQIKEGVELLASAVEEMISLPAANSGLSRLGNFQ